MVHWTIPLTWLWLMYACRNKALETKGVRPPKATSTGTTIVGVLFKVQYSFIEWQEHWLNYTNGRMDSVLVLTREQLKVPSWLTRTAKRFTILHPTCKTTILDVLRQRPNQPMLSLAIAVVQAQLLILKLRPTWSAPRLNYTAFPLEESHVSLLPWPCWSKCCSGKVDHGLDVIFIIGF